MRGGGAEKNRRCFNLEVNYSNKVQSVVQRRDPLSLKNRQRKEVSVPLEKNYYAEEGGGAAQRFKDLGSVVLSTETEKKTQEK